MSWLKKLMPSAHPHRRAAKQAQRARRACGRSATSCGVGAVPAGARGKPRGLPEVQPPHGDPRPRAAGLAVRSRTATQEIGAELGPTDVLKFKDQKKYSDRIKAAQKSTGERDALVAMQGKLKGRDLVAARSTSPSWAARWVRWSANASPSRPNARSRLRLSVRVLLRQRRRAHAGEPVLADADGQDLGRARAPARGGPAVHLGADASDHRRRVGLVRHAGRHQHRRTGSADRLRRPARDRADRARKAAGRLPAFGVPGRPWRDRPDLRPPRNARPPRPSAGADDEAADAAGRQRGRRLEPQVFRHRRHPRPGRRGRDLGRLRAAPGQRLRPCADQGARGRATGASRW